jgi:hypothetical protein
MRSDLRPGRSITQGPKHRPFEDEDEYDKSWEKQKGEREFAFLAEGLAECGGPGLKVELIDVVFGENSWRAEENLAAVYDLELA